MLNTATVTFHASHNYGAVLQAFALQRFLLSSGVDNTIINLRTEILKETSKVLTKRMGFKYILKNIYTILFIYGDRKIKYNKFVEFIKDNLITTNEVGDEKSFAELANCFDCVIAGSGQIWNVGVYGTNDMYFLKGVESKKISYAVSTGKKQEVEDFSDEQKSLIKKLASLSTRDSATANMIKIISGREIPVVLDPTLLHKREFYEEYFAKCLQECLIKEKYIYVYTLDNNKELIDIAKKLAKRTGLKIYISHVSGTHYCFGLKKQLASGPIEFLNHIKFAEYVITSSYHGTLFSIIFAKQFWSYKADSDNRLNEILSALNLKDRSISIKEAESKFDSVISDSEYESVRREIERMAEKSKRYLVDALGGC